MFPITRMRRLRKSANMRSLLQETKITVDDLIYPLFVIEGEQIKNEIPSMPGVYQISLDYLLDEVKEIVEYGLKSIILFGIPEMKDGVGTGAYAEDGIVQEAIRLIKGSYPELVVITDVCLCEYTDHGHCGIIHDGDVLNDPTLALLAKTALSHAKAGADIVAPSDMMDGRINAIRTILDDNGFEDIPIMSYSAKYASAFYGPFRDAAGSAPQFGDRKTYQMDPACSIEQAILETELDVQEGADFIMVKPALAYMDIIKVLKEEFLQPVVCYNVSGEYAMIKAAAQNGWIDEQRVVMEMLLGFKRAGSSLIITYHALDVAKWLKEEK